MVVVSNSRGRGDVASPPFIRFYDSTVKRDLDTAFSLCFQMFGRNMSLTENGEKSALFSTVCAKQARDPI